MGGIPMFRRWDRNRSALGAGKFRRAGPSHGLAARHRCLRPAAEHRPSPQYRYPGAPTCKTSPAMREGARHYEENMKVFGEFRLVRTLTEEQIAAMRDPRVVGTVRLPTIEDAVK